MSIRMTAGLTLAIALGLNFPALAASKHAQRAKHPAVYDRAPDSGPGSGIITSQCLPTDNPCRTRPDGW
jgi:hypothetical protein